MTLGSVTPRLVAACRDETWYQSAKAKVQHERAHVMMKLCFGPGRLCNIHGPRGSGKSETLDWVMEDAVSCYDNAYGFTNICHFEDLVPKDPRFKALPGKTYARINIVKDGMDLLSKMCAVLEDAIGRMKPSERTAYMQGRPPAWMPWNIVMLDEPGNWLNKMRSSAGRAVDFQALMDMSRKLRAGLGIPWHIGRDDGTGERPIKEEQEMIWFTRSWSNKDAEFLKAKDRNGDPTVAIGKYKKRDYTLQPFTWEGIPRTTLPFDTYSTATFDPKLLPLSDLPVTVADIFRALQQLPQGKDSLHSPRSIRLMLEEAKVVAQDEEFSNPLQRIAGAALHK